jgi:error-prone DNA polymerase
LAHRLYGEAEEFARLLRSWFPSSLYLELQDDYTPESRRVCRDLVELGEHLSLPIVATNNVHFATPEDAEAHDVLRCIANRITLSEIHAERPLNRERYLKSSTEMQELFAWKPEAIANTLRIVERCEVALPQGEEITPSYATPEGHHAASYLRHLSYRGAKARYKTLTPKLESRLEHELSVICELGYADYVLMAWKVARWARSQGIRVTGRGSAADSCVAYCLLLTDVDVLSRNLPFARFLVPGKTPDIDLDFDATRREEVFQWIQKEYGAENVAMTCTFHTFLARSAVRDVGKVLALPEEALEFLRNHIRAFTSADKIARAFEKNSELKPFLHLKERFTLLFDLCHRIANFPRHIGTHSSGVVVSRVPISRIAPMQPTATHVLPLLTFDKDDVETLGAIKLDVLSLRILSAIEDTVQDVKRKDPAFQYGRIPSQDVATYKKIQRGEALGSFQIESPAQLALAMSLSPEHFEDLVASVALIRPGPIRGNLVSRFVACRNGWSRADVLHPSLAPILAKTYGCIVFQEQAIQVLATLMGISEAEADRFRKQLAPAQKWGRMDEMLERFATQVIKRFPELSLEHIERIWGQIEGWSGYGFTEGHAASFAITAYKSAYFSTHHPAEYFSALLSNQPMGYYSTNTLASDARRQGVNILPLDINRSQWKCKGETEESLRLGFCLVEGLREEDGKRMEQEREKRPFLSLLDFWTRVPLHRDRMESLVLGGAFDALHPYRRGLMWRLEESFGLAQSLRTLSQNREQQALEFWEELETPCAWDIEEFTEWDKHLWEWRVTGVISSGHPVGLLRERLKRFHILPVAEALKQPNHAEVTIAGLNICPHRPPTRSGKPILFTGVEDETGIAQIACMGEALERYIRVFLLSPAVIVRGKVQRRGVGASLMVEKAKPLLLNDYLEKPREDAPFEEPTRELLTHHWR